MTKEIWHKSSKLISAVKDKAMKAHLLQQMNEYAEHGTYERLGVMGKVIVDIAMIKETDGVL